LRAGLVAPRADDEETPDLSHEHPEEGSQGFVALDLALPGPERPARQDSLEPAQGLGAVAGPERVEEGVDVLGAAILDERFHVDRADLPSLARPAEDLFELGGEEPR